MLNDFLLEPNLHLIQAKTCWCEHMSSSEHPDRGQCFSSYHQSAERHRLVAQLTWHIFFIWRLPSFPGERLGLFWQKKLDFMGELL